MHRTHRPAPRVATAFAAALLVAGLLAGLAGCTAAAPPVAPAQAVVPAAPLAPQPEAPEPAARVVHVTLLQINDVYEITPVEGGKSGGLARVATVLDRLRAENPGGTFALLAGDLFSPSAMGTAKVDGERLDGRQMVAVLNAVGIDYATFGNHEFDIPEKAFYQRLAESRFGWVSGNVTLPSGEPIPGVAPYEILTVGEEGGQRVRIGLIGATLQFGEPSYARISDPLASLKRQAEELKHGDSPKVDVLVALTHQSLDQDVRAIEQIPEIDLVLGGHEHENYQRWRGPGFTPIFKADANVRSVYVQRLAYDTATGKLTIDPHLQVITDAIPADPKVDAVVKHWSDLAFAGFRASGFEPEAVVAEVPIALDGREASVRNGSTELTDLIGSAMLAAAPDAELAVYNSGSIRIDDVLPPGPLTQYDVIRILPFGGDVVEANLTGALLAKVLDQGRANRGEGGYLQTAKVASAPGGGWQVGGQPLDPARTYRVALNDFLLSGKESGLGYLTADNPDVTVLGTKGDIRKAVIEYLQATY